MTRSRVVNHENVNGVNLTLIVNKRSHTPNSQRFTITYENIQKKSTWRIKFLISAIIFNVFALSFVRISLMAMLVIIIVFSFLVFFWVTHSVQSESIHFIPTVGIQSTTKYVIGREENFVPWLIIDDIIINEVIKFNRVLYFLTLIIKPSSPRNEMDSFKLIPLFKYTKPKLYMLEIIYSELQQFLSTLDESQSGSGDAE